MILGRDDERVRKQIAFDAELHRWSPADPLLRWRVANRLAYQFGQHHALLSAEMMTTLLRENGFTRVRTVDVGSSCFFVDVPTTHFDRFPDSRQEVFAVEGTAG